MSIYNKLDVLQQKALSKIKDIINAIDSYNIEDEHNFDVHSQKLTHEAYSVISEYKNLLSLSKNTDSLAYHVYHDRLTDLKVKLREAQLTNSRATNELIQRQILLKYNRVSTGAEGTKTLEEQRDELFRGKSQKAAETSKLSGQAQLLDKNKAITASLQTTRQMMSTSIMHTELNIDTIDQQSKDLSQLNDKFTDFNDLLNKSRAIVKFIQKQDRDDKNKIYLSLGFLAISCAWVIWRRILKMPVYFMLWSFFKIFRIFNWMIGPSAAITASQEAIIVASTTSTAALISATMATSMAVSELSKPELADEELTVNIEDDSEIQTWEEIVSHTLGIEDEL